MLIGTLYIHSLPVLQRREKMKAGEGMVTAVSPDEHSVRTLQQLPFLFSLTLSEDPSRGVSCFLVLALGASQHGCTYKLLLS